MMLVSDTAIDVSQNRWRKQSKKYRIDDVPVLNLQDPTHRRRLEQVLGEFTPYDDEKRNTLGLETRESILKRTKKDFLITDDNMGTEWRQLPSWF